MPWIITNLFYKLAESHGLFFPLLANSYHDKGNKHIIINGTRFLLLFYQLFFLRFVSPCW
jgi:hypothetical protein